MSRCGARTTRCHEDPDSLATEASPKRIPGFPPTEIARIGGDDLALQTWNELLTAPIVSDDEIDEGY